MNPETQIPDQEEDSDYDIFASVRPSGIMVDDNPQDEADGEEIEDWEQVRPREEEVAFAKADKNKPKKQFTPREIAKDVAKQGGKELLIGLGGTYGDLAELAGLNKQIPSQEAKPKQDFETLEKLSRPGYKPSFADISSLSEDDDLMPASTQLPTSESLRGFNEAVGGPGKAETEPGRYAGRIGKLAGQGLAFGQVNPAPAAVAGGAGQYVEEQGGSPLAQAAAEIAGLLLTPAGKARALTSGKEKVRGMIDELRNLGYTDEQITLAINSANKNSKLVKAASKGTKTEQAFENFAEHSDDLIGNILAKEVPGFEKGAQEVHQLASDAYGEVAKQGSNLVIKDSTPFTKSVKFVEDEIRKNLDISDEATSFITRINKASEAAKNSPTAESMMNFYKELNKAGTWMGRSEKDRLLTHLKNGIKDSFRSQGKEGVELANNFEKVNKGIRKAFLAEDVGDILTKAKVEGKIDYKKLNKSLDKPDNIKLFEEVLGKDQAKNLKTISNVGKQVKDFDKSWKTANSFSSGMKLDTAHGLGSLYFLYQGDWKNLAITLGAKGSIALSRRLAEKSLTDPKFQNLMIKGLHAVKSESPRLMKSANEGMKKYLEEQGVDIDLSLPKKND